MVSVDKDKKNNNLLVHFDSNYDKVVIISAKGEIIEITMPSSSNEFQISKLSNSIKVPEKIYPLPEK